MSTKSKKTLSVNKELYKETDKAAYLIHKITGKDLALIQSRLASGILQYLSYLLNVGKKEDMELNWRNDKSSSILYNIYKYDKRVTKGILSPKYKSYGTNKTTHDFIKLFSAKLGDLAFRRTVTGDISVNFANPYASTSKPPVTYSIANVNLQSINLNKIISHQIDTKNISQNVQQPRL